MLNLPRSARLRRLVYSSSTHGRSRSWASTRTGRSSRGCRCSSSSSSSGSRWTTTSSQSRARGSRRQSSERRGGPTGITATAAVVTTPRSSCAASSRSSGPSRRWTSRGASFCAAILIDATIVRAVLLPASPKLLGDRNWYPPKALEAWSGVALAPEAPEGVEQPGAQSRASSAVIVQGDRIVARICFR